MITNISLQKPGLKTSLAEAFYNEVLSNTNNYYYFLGKPLEWIGGATEIGTPQNTLLSDSEIRKEMVFVKKITTSDIAFTIPRYDWTSGQVYDQYDDQIGSNVTYSVAAGPYTFNLNGTFDLSKFGQGWHVTGTGIAPNTYIDEATPSQIKLTKQTVANVTSITITNRADYKETDSDDGAISLETSRFYVLTDERNVYKCLFNNNGAKSTVKPFSTTHETIKTNDGYIWKYMYTIPNALANKFMSLYDMPVTTAVKSAYYSNGAITSAIVESYGTNYAPNDQLVIIGDGNATDNVYRINGINIETPGSGYTSPPTISITPPYNAIGFETETNYLVGQYLYVDTELNDRFFYKVLSGGTSGTTIPIHTGEDAVVNGTCTLKFVGMCAHSTSTIDNGAVSSITMQGIIANILIENPGFGYDPLNPPEVIINGDGIGATAIAEVSHDGYVTNIRLTNRGSGYTAATAAIDAPNISSITFDGSSESVINVTNNTITYTDHGFVTGNRVKYDNGDGTDIEGLSPLVSYYVIAINADTFKLSTSYIGAIKQTNIVDITDVGTGTNHTISSDHITAIASVNFYHGYGYEITPTSSVSDPFAYDYVYANQTVVAVNDIIKSGNRFYKVITAVSPYKLGVEIPSITSGTMTSGNCTLEFIGETASVSVNVNKTAAHLIPIIENGHIVNVISQDPGFGYTSAEIKVSSVNGSGAIIIPNLSIGNLNTRQANTELLAISGTIDAIDILHSGINYSWASVEITGDGTGCTAEAVITQGAITKINVTNPGFGYTYANVTITGNGNATQAYARVIISPTYGHGRDAIKELFAKDIALATTIAQDKNQGFVVKNDYRQLGLLKNPTIFNSYQRYTRLSGSPCYTITGNFSYIDIEDDMEMQDQDGNKFIVIAKPVEEPNDGNVQLLVQSIDNADVLVGSVFTYDINKTATISIVSQPTIDKYSGEILFVDNRRAFQPTEEQALSIKTVIRL